MPWQPQRRQSVAFALLAPALFPVFRPRTQKQCDNPRSSQSPVSLALSLSLSAPSRKHALQAKGGGVATPLLSAEYAAGVLQPKKRHRRCWRPGGRRDQIPGAQLGLKSSERGGGGTEGGGERDLTFVLWRAFLVASEESGKGRGHATTTSLFQGTR